MKKKAIEQKNKLTVHNFKKTFQKLNNREPLDNEIIDNLNEEMDEEELKKWIYLDNDSNV